MTWVDLAALGVGSATALYCLWRLSLASGLFRALYAALLLVLGATLAGGYLAPLLGGPVLLASNVVALELLLLVAVLVGALSIFDRRVGG